MKKTKTTSKKRQHRILSSLTLPKRYYTLCFTFSSRWSSSSSSSSATAAEAVPSTPKISHEELVTDCTKVFGVVGKRRVVDDSDGGIGCLGLCLFVAHILFGVNSCLSFVFRFSSLLTVFEWKLGLIAVVRRTL